MDVIIAVYVLGVLLTGPKFARFLLDDTVAPGVEIDAADIAFCYGLGFYWAVLWPIIVPFLIIRRLMIPYAQDKADRLNDERPSVSRHGNDRAGL